MCSKMADEMAGEMNLGIYMHILCFVVCLQRELNETNIEGIGKFFKGLEVISMIGYLLIIINSLRVFDNYLL